MVLLNVPYAHPEGERRDLRGFMQALTRLERPQYQGGPEKAS
jgi:hypothetical protein